MINRLKVTSFGDPQHQETTNLFALILRQSTEESGLARELKSVPDLARTHTRALSPKDTTPLAAHH